MIRSIYDIQQALAEALEEGNEGEVATLLREIEEINVEIWQLSH